MDLTNYNPNTLIGGTDDDDRITNMGSNVTVKASNGNDTLGLSIARQVLDYTSPYSGAHLVMGYSENATIALSDLNLENFLRNNDSNSFSGSDVALALPNNTGSQPLTLNDAVGTKINLSVNGSPLSMRFVDADHAQTSYSPVDYLILNASGSTLNANSQNVFNYGSNALVNGSNTPQAWYNNASNATVNSGSGADTLDNEGTAAVLNSGAGTDYISNSGEAASINAGNGNDSIVNAADNASLLGGDDNDSISNSARNVLIDGGAGDDSIRNTGSNSTLQGGDGNDSISNSAANSSVNGDDGNDYINNLADNVSIGGGLGNDSIFNSGSNVYVDAGDGNDYIDEQGTDSTVRGGRGNDEIHVGTRTIIEYAPDDGNDVIFGFGFDDTLSLTDGAISSAAKSGNDMILNVGNNAVTLKAVGDTPVQVRTSDGNLTAINFDGTVNFVEGALVSGTAGADKILNSARNVTIDALDDNDLIINTGSDAVVNGNAGNDTVSNAGDKVLINGDAGDDNINNSGLLVTVNGAIGNDSIANSGENVSVNGGAGNDIVNNTGSNSTLQGGDGNDSIVNDADNVTLLGGAGNDTLSNKSGSNVILNGGDDADYLENVSGNKVVLLGGDGNDSIDNAGADASVRGGAGDDHICNSSAGATVNADAGNDYIELGGSNQLVEYNSGDGNDTIIGFSDGDTLKFNGAAFDEPSVSGGNVLINVGSGSVLLKGITSTSITLVDSEGTVIEASVGTVLDGTDGDDVLENSDDGALIRPKLGDDSIVLNGSRQVVEITGGNDTVTGADSDDTIRVGGYFNASVSGNDLIFATSENDSLTLKNAADKKVNIVNFNDPDNPILYVPPVGATIDVDSGISDVINVFDNVTIEGGDKNIFVDSFGANNVNIKTANGDDLLFATDNTSIENITVNSGAGSDTVNVGFARHFVVDAGADNDYIIVDTDQDGTVDAGDGNDIISVTDSEKVTIIGGAGNDSIRITDSDAVIKYSEGDGNDTVTNNAAVNFVRVDGTFSNPTYSGGNVVLNVGSGSITFTDTASNIVPIAVLGADNKVSAWYKNSNALTPIDSDTVVSADGYAFNVAPNATVDASSLEASSVLNFGSNVDILGAETADVITNYGSNVTINAGLGDDHITLHGSNQLVRYETGDGNDVIVGVGSDDTVQIVGAYSSARSGNDVIVTVDDGTLTLKDVDIVPRIETAPSGAEIAPNILASVGSEGITYDTRKPSKLTVEDPFTGIVSAADISDKITNIDAAKSNLPVVLVGGNKANIISAGKGSSTLIGGKAADKLYGGSGVNVFAYKVDGSKDIFNSFEAQDIASIDGATRNNIVLKDGKSNVTVTFKNDKNAKLTINKTGATDPVRFRLVDGEFVYGAMPDGASLNAAKTSLLIKAGASVDSATELEASLIASTIKELNASDYEGKVNLVGNENSNVLRASKGGSTLYGGHLSKAIADKMYGGDGADVFRYAAGDGADVIYSLNGSQGDYVLVKGVTTIDASKVKDTGSKLVVPVAGGSLTFDKPDGVVKLVSADTGDILYQTGINFPDGIGYNPTRSIITLGAEAQEIDEIDLSGTTFSPNVKEINASAYGKPVNLIGNANANVLRAGTAGSTLYGGAGGTKPSADKLYGGAGQDVFVYSSLDGADIIYSLDGGQQDYVLLKGIETLDASNFSVTANKITAKIGKYNLTLDKPKGKVKFVNDSGTAIYEAGINFSEGVDYNITKSAVTVGSNAVDIGSINLSSTEYLPTVKEINATLYGGDLNLHGNAQANVLRAGTGAATLDGGYDTAKRKVTADKLYGSTAPGASDVFVWDAVWGGADQIYNYDASAGDIISITGDVSIGMSDFKMGTNKVVLTAGSNKLTVNAPKNDVVVAVHGDDTIKFGALPDGVEWNDTARKKLNVGAEYAGGTINATEFTAYSSSLATIDAGSSTARVRLVGYDKGKVKTFVGGKTQTTFVGSKLNDTFVGGDGEDVFVFSVGSGKDVITNFDTATDVISLVGESTVTIADFTEKNGDVTLTLDSKNTLTIKNAPRGYIAVEFDGGEFSYKTLPENVTYNAAKGLVSATKDFTGTIDANTLERTVKEITASTANGTATLQAGTETTKLTASKGGSRLIGSSTDETLVGGAGNDVFVLSGGNDVIDKYAAGDVVQVTGALTSGELSGTKDVKLTTADGSTTIKGAVGKELTILSGGVASKYKFTRTETTLEKALVGGGSSSSELAAGAGDYWFTSSDESTDELGTLMSEAHSEFEAATGSLAALENDPTAPTMKIAVDVERLTRRKK